MDQPLLFDIVIQSLLIILHICILYYFCKRYQHTNQNITHQKSTKICFIVYAVYVSIQSILNIIYDITEYIKINNNTTSINTINRTAELGSASLLYFGPTCMTYFMKSKLEDSFKKTFLSLNKKISNICFGILVISIIIGLISWIHIQIMQHFIHHTYSSRE